MLSGSVFKPDPVYVENGDLGIGGCPDGSNLFKGWIDDVRIYKTTLSQNDIDIAYGDGFGDFGPIGDFSANSSSSISPIPVTLTFRDSFGNPVNVSDLDPNDNNGTKDIDLVGGTITNFIVDNNSTYRFDLVPDRKPQRLFLKLNSGAAVDINGDFSQKNSVVITYNDKVTRSANLVGWWSFDEANGTLVPDQSGGDAFAKLIGGAGISNSNPKFGTGALLLDGSDSWAEVGALMAPTKTTREDDLIGWWKFDEASGTDAINSVNGSSDASLVDNAAFSIIEKKFGGSSLHLPTNSSNARVTLSPALDLGGTSTVATFTISTWFRNLYPTGSWRTLSRGSTNGHHLIVSDVTNRVGVFANGNGDWRDSGEFDLEADGFMAPHRCGFKWFIQ